VEALYSIAMDLPLERLLLALLPCLSGCDGTRADDSGEADVDTDTDTDPDACCVHSGMRNVGGTWEWAYTGDHEDSTGESGTWTSALDREEGSLFLSQEGNSNSSWTGMETWWTALFEYTCDPLGVWIVHAETEYTWENATVSGDGWSDTTYFSPGLVMPRSIGLGSTWTQEASGRMQTEETAAEFTYVTDFEVVSQGTTTVPGGTFETFRVNWATEDESGAFQAAVGVGTVWTGDEVLLDWSPGR